MSRSDDLIREIQVETERRKKVWGKMMKVAEEVVAATNREAKKQGIQNTHWWFLPGNSGTDVAIEYTVKVGGEIFSRRVSLATSGKVFREGDGTYEGYPDLTDDDPDAFRVAAVKWLMRMINYYKDAN